MMGMSGGSLCGTHVSKEFTALRLNDNTHSGLLCQRHLYTTQPLCHAENTRPALFSHLCWCRKSNCTDRLKGLREMAERDRKRVYVQPSQVSHMIEAGGG